MGTGEFICVSMTGGAPWGFRLQGGGEQKQPLRVAKIRSQSKASGSGLREGDEVVSINGCPCAGLSHPQVVELMESVADSLHLLVKRASGGISETLAPETEPGTQQQPPQGGHAGGATLQIQLAPPNQDGEPCVVRRVESGAPLAEDPGRGPALPGSSKEETGPSRPQSPRAPAAPRGLSAEGLARPGPVVELQLCLSRAVPSGVGPPVAALLGAETSRGPDPHPDSDCSGTAHGNSAPSREQAAPPLRSSKVVQLRGGREPRMDPGRGEAGAAGQPRVEVIFGCTDRQRREGCGLPAAAGGVDSPGGGGRPEAPPPLAAFAVSSEGTEPGDEPRGGRDHSRPHRHRARHARLRRSESLSEKQAKEAKSRCRSIALLLTAPPSPHARGVLMFKKLRQRARKFTLVSYGTGELRQRQEAAGDPEEDGHSDSPFEEALLGASESDGDGDEEELPADGDSSAHVLTFGWDPAPAGAEERPTREARMEMLPDTSGKGALMFAKRRERMDQIAAQREDAAGAQADGPSAGASYRRAEEAAVTRQSCVSRSYIEVSPGPGPGHAAPQHNGLGAAPYAEEARRTAPTNRTARPFPGATAAFPPPGGWTSPTADFPAPPPYSAVTPPPGALAHLAGSPTAGPAQPPPWPQPAPWAPECIIASRDERIAVPAKRTGILQEAKRRGAAKPMFTFKEPKVSPNPELLSLLQNSEGRRGPGGAGGDSGPEEDYLSLGAEACNFMQGPSAKQKTPPPVAPKPAAKPSPPSQPGTPATPVSPVWSLGLAPAHPPAFPAATQPQGAVASSVKIAPPSYPPARPASALSPAGPSRGPPAAVASVNYTASAAKPAAPVPAAAAGPPSELPGMQGRGAQLFAKRQSRMEKYVVDSDTVQAHAARAQSPTPSLPAGWKYSSNIRAPPPVGYNPIHSPSYPPAAAARSQPPAPQAPRPGRKKGKKPLNALDVMKHQPYQLNASLFTFQPPDAKASLPQRSPTKVNSAPAVKQAPPSPAVSASSPANRKAASVCSLPARSPQPAFFPEAASPVSASPVPGGVPSSPKQEPASTAAAFLAPRPKFSAKKSGVVVQVWKPSIAEG